ncbi:MAG: hypothetical protein ACK4NW_12825 [Roseinatronobacter sp.]
MTTPKAESIEVRDVERLHESLGSVETPEHMHGDNLSILLCTFFEDREGEFDDNGWTEAAVSGQEAVLQAIRDHYGPAFEAILARAEAAERQSDGLYERLSVVSQEKRGAQSERDELRDEVVRLCDRLTTAQASIGAAWCEGRDAVVDMNFPEGWRDLGDGMNLKQQGLWASGFRSCRNMAEELTPPPDAAAALQRAEDAAWNAAIYAAEQAAHEADSLELAQHGAESIANRIRALRKEG